MATEDFNAYYGPGYSCMDFVNLLNFWLEKHLLAKNNLFIMFNYIRIIYQINRLGKLHYNF